MLISLLITVIHCDPLSLQLVIKEKDNNKEKLQNLIKDIIKKLNESNKENKIEKNNVSTISIKNNQEHIKNGINENQEVIEKLAKLFLKVKNYSDRNNKENEYYKNPIIYRPIDIVTTFKNHYELICKKFKSDEVKIKDILIYEYNGRKTDYWEILNFNDNLIDKSGIFRGVKSNEKGKLSQIGFFKLNRDDDENDYKIITGIIDELSKNLNKKPYEIFKENKKLNQVDRLIFKRNFEDTNKCLYVCECKDQYCQDPCINIRCITI